MAVHIEIPDGVLDSLKLPPAELEFRLRAELALALYGQSILPFGKASELAGQDRYAFGELVATRGLPRHYTEEDLSQDLAYARGQ